MTRQLISTKKQPLLRSSHAKRPPQSGFVQVDFYRERAGPLRAVSYCDLNYEGARSNAVLRALYDQAIKHNLVKQW